MRCPAFVLLFMAGCLWVTASPAVGDEAAGRSDRESPPTHCIVSGDHLNAGEIVFYTYKREGQPDLRLRFCCGRCLARFKADPERYLKRAEADPAKKDQGGQASDEKH